MNCDDFLPNLETGGMLRRWRARRHAARCPRCVIVYTALRAATAQLAAPEPLSPHARDLWMRAARESPVQPVRTVRWVPAVACLAAAACLLVVFIGIANWVNPLPKSVVTNGPHETRTVSPVTVVQIDPAQEFSELADVAGQLEMELQSLRIVAERAAAQREVMIALNQYSKW